MIIENQIEVTSAALFLKEAEENLIYIYNTDLNKSGVRLKIFTVYWEFSDVFNEKAENILPFHWEELNHHIKLLLHITPFFRLLYYLTEQELMMLKTYIDKHLHSEFIICFKSFAASLILFIKMKNDLLRLYVNYRGLNIIFIKNKDLQAQTWQSHLSEFQISFSTVMTQNFNLLSSLKSLCICDRIADCTCNACRKRIALL